MVFSATEARAARQANAEVVQAEKDRTDAQDASYNQAAQTFAIQQDASRQDNMIAYVQNQIAAANSYAVDQDAGRQANMVNYVQDQLTNRATVAYVQNQIAAANSYADGQDQAYWAQTVNRLAGKADLAGDAFTGPVYLSRHPLGVYEAATRNWCLANFTLKAGATP